MSAVRAAPWSRRVVAQALFESGMILRHGEQLLLSIILPLIVLFGLATTEVLCTLEVLPPGSRPIDVATPGVLAVCLVSSAFTGQAIGTGFDRRYGVLRHLATTPLGRSGLLGGKLIAVLLVIVTQVLVIGGAAAVLGWRPDLSGLPAALVSIVLGTAAFLALGLLLAGTVRAEATLAGANLVWVLLLAGGGLVVQPTGAWGTVTSLLPSGALGNALRAAFIHGQADLGAWLVLTVWALVAGLATLKWFRWS